MRQTIKGREPGQWMEFTDHDLHDEIASIVNNTGGIIGVLNGIKHEIDSLHRIIYKINQPKIFKEGTTQEVKVYNENGKN